MQSKSTLAIVLTLIGLNGAVFTICGYMMSYFTRGFFSGATLLSCILLMAGVVLLRDQMAHSTEHQ